ncbi:MAG TPA: chemotaxis protein CheA, partial [Hyphomicrobium sp.]|nr:chemotaxis protein CheA [Hyphomicrobium sp.]
VRAGEIPVTSDIANNLLGAFDIVSDHVAAAMGRGAVPDDGAMLGKLEAILQGETPAPSPPKGAKQVVELPPASPQINEAADEFGFMPVAIDLDELEDFSAGPDNADENSSPSPAVNDDMPWSVQFAPSRAAMANGAEPLLVIRELERMGGTVTHANLDALPALRDLDPEQAYISWSISVPGSVEKQEIDECFDFVAPDSVIIYERETAESDNPPSQTLAEIAPASVFEQSDPDTAPAAYAATAAATAAIISDPKTIDPGSQTIRIDVSRLDMLLNLVGELVISNSILTDRLAPEDQERVELPQLGRLTREIQDNVMSLRAQPIRQAFSRVPRIVRELCSATAKQVNLDVRGETTEVDKSVIEKIGEPLTHMIRNAIDHGLETPEERIAAGKNPVGTVRLSAEQKGARIVIQVSDDGRGIDRERVRQKAIDKGVIAADAILSDEDIDALICAPGFSTAETISNISGRGVGMDVVRTNVEALGGRIEIISTPGSGTSFTMVLPLTLAILDGMIVRLSGQRYVVPLSHVVESIRPEPGQVKALSPTSEVIDLRGSYVPVLRVSDLFGLHAN